MAQVRAAGRLYEHPMPSLLVAIRREALTGYIGVDQGADNKSLLYFRQGLPVHVERPDPLDRLDRVLVETGLVPAGAMDVAEQVRAKTGRPLGEILCEQRFITHERLKEAFRYQLLRKLARLFRSSLGTFEAVQADHLYGLAPPSTGFPVDPRTVIYPAIRAAYDDARLAEELKPLVGKIVRLAKDADAVRLELGATSVDSTLLSLLRGPGLLVDESGIRGSGGERIHDRKVLLLSLLYLGLLSLGGVVLPRAPLPPVETSPVVPTRPPTPRPARASAEPARPPTTSAEAAVPPAAVTPEVPAPRPDEVLGKLARLDPASVFRTGETALREGDLRRAEDAFEALAHVDGAKPKYLAYLTWIRCSSSGASGLAEADVMTVIREALAADPEFAFGHFMLGECLRIGEKIPQAIRAYQAALRYDAKLFEAERALRLLSMRKGSTRGRDKKS